MRTGELDVAILRAGADSPVIDTRALWSTQLWREPVHVALPSSHPLAQSPSLRLAHLADLPVRMPGENCDPLVRGFIIDACRRAGFEPRPGRRMGSLPDTLVEIGAGSPNWTFVYGDRDAVTATDRVAILPVEPDLTVTATLITSATRSSACAETLRQAFSALEQEPVAA